MSTFVLIGRTVAAIFVLLALCHLGGWLAIGVVVAGMFLLATQPAAMADVEEFENECARAREGVRNEQA